MISCIDSGFRTGFSVPVAAAAAAGGWAAFACAAMSNTRHVEVCSEIPLCSVTGAGGDTRTKMPITRATFLCSNFLEGMLCDVKGMEEGMVIGVQRSFC